MQTVNNNSQDNPVTGVIQTDIQDCFERLTILKRLQSSLKYVIPLCLGTWDSFM